MKTYVITIKSVTLTLRSGKRANDHYVSCSCGWVAKGFLPTRADAQNAADEHTQAMTHAAPNETHR